ncbi:NACHT domain-containing NTPase [Nonomuraea sp. MG754425]|uniref:NACHT domain-containing protein n=1 Tax=Nonomuraea sp. MG754425 TaxID=2570319 RepID=UPI001F383D00|nr:NACHT domain-containing protein [Nonomuraea sp. MG754425]
MAALPPAPGSLIGKIVLLAVALGPPALAGAGLWPQVRAHPALAAGAVLMWWVLVLAGRLAAKVGGEVSAVWAPRMAGAVDRAVMSRTSYRSHYVAGLSRLLRFVDLEGVPTQGEHTLRLQDVYVDVSLVPRPLHGIAHEPYLGTAAPAPGERVSLRRFLAGAEPVVLAVVAGPGSGKTTLLRRTALERCGRRRGLPVLLLLRDHVKTIVDDPKVPLSAVIASEPWLHGAVPASWFERSLGRGRCLVLLDGLDEVAGEEDRKKMVAWARAQIARYPGNDFVITSRPYGYESNPLNGASVLSVRRFTPAQVSRFVHGWYAAVEARATGEKGPHVAERARKSAGELLERLRGQASLHDLAANPLLLTMIVNVHRYRGALPGSRAELYGEMCQVLLYRRREAKGVATAIELKGVQRERVLREVALRMMRGRLRDLTAGRLHRMVGPALGRIAARVDPEAFVEEVTRTGLLVERESGSYAFAHLTLQEYLAAARLREGDDGAGEVLAGHVDDPWWRETTLLWGAGSDVGVVVSACLESGSVPALSLAFDCQQEAAELAPELRARLDDLLSDPAPALRRVMSEVAVARSLRRVVTIGRDTEVCAVPVPVGLYRRFVLDEATAGRYRRPDGMREWPADDRPVSGVWDVDLGPFLAWVNERAQGVRYRLPAPEECADPTVRLIAGTRPVWCGDGERPSLAVPPGGGHPFAVSEAAVRERWADDLRCAAWVYLAAVDRVLVRELGLDVRREDALVTAVDTVVAVQERLDRVRPLLRGVPSAGDLVAGLDEVGARFTATGLARRAAAVDPAATRLIGAARALRIEPELCAAGILRFLDEKTRETLRFVVELHDLRELIDRRVKLNDLIALSRQARPRAALELADFAELFVRLSGSDLIGTGRVGPQVRQALAHEGPDSIAGLLDVPADWAPRNDARRRLMNEVMLDGHLRHTESPRRSPTPLDGPYDVTGPVWPGSLTTHGRLRALLEAVTRRELPLDDAVATCLRVEALTGAIDTDPISTDSISTDSISTGAISTGAISTGAIGLAHGVTALQLRARGAVVPDDVIVLVRG